MISMDKTIYKTAIKGNFPDTFEMAGIKYRKKQDLRYGDNPGQAAAFYIPEEADFLVTGDLGELKSGKQGLSATNLSDIDHAFRTLKYFEDPACAVMKHLNPSGVAVQTKDRKYLRDIYINARDCDFRSAFGSVAGFNTAVDKDTADEIMSTFVECVAAPEYGHGVLDILSKPSKGFNRDIRVVKIKNIYKLSRFFEEDALTDVKMLEDGSIILQEKYLSKVRGPEDLNVVTERQPTNKEYEDLLFAWRICANVRSNAIVFAKNRMTVAIGTGEQERVGAVEQAIEKAKQKYAEFLKDYIEKLKDEELQGSSRIISILTERNEGDLRDSVVASDGFFPFRDSIDLISKYGVSAVIQPGGSINDKEIIEACNKYGIAMVFTPERVFAHF